MKLLLCALVSCGLVAVATNAALRTLQPDKFGPARKVLDVAGDPQTNFLFLGTSRIERGVIPEVFDKAMENAGVPGVHSYNAAQPDSLLIENQADAEKLFNLKPQGIKFVVFEPNLAGQLMALDHNTLRAINFFNLRNAFRALKLLNLFSDSAVRGHSRSVYIKNILEDILRHYFDVGLVWARPDDDSSRFSATSRGYPDLATGVRQVLEPTDAYNAQLGDIGRYRPRPALISDGQLDLALGFAAYIKSHGAVPIMIRTPQTSNWGLAADFIAKFAQRCAERGPLLFDFSSPTEYAALWNPRNRMDDDHLNTEGAEIFTRLIAERLAAAINDNSIAMPLCQAADG